MVSKTSAPIYLHHKFQQNNGLVLIHCSFQVEIFVDSKKGIKFFCDNGLD